MNWGKKRRRSQKNELVFTDSDFEELLASSKKNRSSLTTDRKTVDVHVVSCESSKLTPLELSEKEQLERQVEEAFFIAGEALRSLRDRRLYRDTHRTFEQYCQDRFGHTRQKINYLIAGAAIYSNLTTARCQVLPAGEYQVRPLSVLESELQPEAWNKAVSLADGKVPTSRIVREVVEQYKEKPEHNPFELGEVVGVESKDNPLLRGRNGAWGIVTGVSKHHCNLQLWDTEFEEVGVEYLKELNYTEEDCLSISQLHGRIEKLLGVDNLEETAKSFLRILGKIQRPYLTPLEEQILGVLESTYSLHSRYSRHREQ
ncbi:conserved hypothetical protein (plasmid) [Gloeothece citriformis PCC 7424]|uniref:Uncharacterized protein n=1 Tax=Gloeothece citriformis (strain PCC 7424) TaxID=65393 RepID=B7KLU9_GLOC7|nr:hypothetical protein [Gloeothece citriformis]ACK73771.1 conserved hypothetical protein [Gloeothece citriformis PCC 7424]